MLSKRCRVLGIRAAAVAAVWLSGSVSAVAEGDVERGKILGDTCKGCHAVDSYTNVYPTYHVPRIGAQNEDYLIAALTLYRDGDRPHSTMQAQASAYSDQDIRDIAAWIASIYPTATAGNPEGSAPESAVTCQSCHGTAGVGQIPSYPIIAGQHEDYLLQSLREYKNGERKGPNGPVMQSQLLSLSDRDLKELAKFYANQDGLKVLPLD